MKSAALREWVPSWKAVWAKSWYLPASAVLDIAFFFLYGLMTAPLFSRLSDHVVAIGALVARQIQADAGRARPAVVDALFQPPASQYVWQFIGLLLLLAMVLFFLFCTIQGLAWWIAAIASGWKMHWRKFLTGFARINLLWAGLYFVWVCIGTLLEVRSIAIEKIMGQPAAGAGIVHAVLIGIIAYFALASYPLLSIKKGFVTGVRKILVLATAGAIIALQLVAGNFLMGKLSLMSAKLSFIISAITLLVLVGWSRAYATRVVRRAADV